LAVTTVAVAKRFTRKIRRAASSPPSLSYAVRRPVLYLSDILRWADAFRRRVGRWPHYYDGAIPGKLGLSWNAVDLALRRGLRGLPRGSSLAKLLRERRGHRHKGLLPPYKLSKVLAWADAHLERTGNWPTCWSGPIPEAPGETWRAVDKALRNGGRGLSGGSSLARLLGDQRGVRNRKRLPRLSAVKVLAWADAHHQRTGRWPTLRSGPVVDAPGESWAGLNQSFHSSTRGLAGYGSLAQFLARKGRTRHREMLPPLSVREILRWAHAHKKRTGRWPNHTSGAIPEAPGETWGVVHEALRFGRRGLPGGSSLYCLLGEHRAAAGYPSRRG
jgi:hypothetical protein